MPSAPPTACPCGGRKVNGRCDRCSAKREQRDSAAARGYDYRWQKARKNYLAANPLCTECQWYGFVTPAYVVDHKRPHKGNQRLFWDQDNWQPLCEKCHNTKTAGEDESMPKYVVCGPPGAGKTTWVKQRARPGDLVFDADYLMSTMFNVPVHTKQDHGAAMVERLRAVVVDWLLQYPDRNAYVIQADRQRAEETAYKLGATLVMIDERHEARTLGSL